MGTNTMTLAKLKMLEANEPELREARYRRLRATTVLAANSSTVREMNDKRLNKALAAMREQNFDMERVSPKLVEHLFATFDDELTDKITAEFRFFPKWTNIRNHGGCVAHCDLCGKGDSLEHRENRDKLRYTFRLENTAGGTEVWVGSSCILHHGLHVEGARTAEEAERLLNKAFNQAMLQFKIEEWRAENPDHFEIPELWERFRKVRFYVYHQEYYAKFGIDRREMVTGWYRLMGQNKDGSRNHFKGAFRQYTKRGGLTEGKHEAWIEARRMMAICDTIFPVFREALTKHGWGKALDHIEERAKKIKRSAQWKRITAPPESVKNRKKAATKAKKAATKKRSPRKANKRRPRRVKR